MDASKDLTLYSLMNLLAFNPDKSNTPYQAPRYIAHRLDKKHIYFNVLRQNPLRSRQIRWLAMAC